jgi:hypothetical protein
VLCKKGGVLTFSCFAPHCTILDQSDNLETSAQQLYQTVIIAQFSHSRIGHLQMSHPPKSMSSSILQVLPTCGPTTLSSSLPKCAVLSGMKPKIWTTPLCAWNNQHFLTTGLMFGPNYEPGTKIVQQGSLNSTSMKTMTTLLAHRFRLSSLQPPVLSHPINYIIPHACCCWISSR